MIVDANVLVYTADSSAPQHQRAVEWLEESLSGPVSVGLPWSSLIAFVRVTTHPRLSAQPLTVRQAWHFVTEWLQVPVVWSPVPTADHARVLGELLARSGATGNLVHDADLAALAVTYGVPVVSADSDFARFAGVRWVNPFAG